MAIQWDNNKSYLLGVIHGDGHIANRSIEIAVGYKDSDYADYLVSLIKQCGYTPRVYRARSAMRIDINSVVLANELIDYKNNGAWHLPDGLDIKEWIAGVFDTDGCVALAPKRAIIIGLKQSGNLTYVASALESLGIVGIRIHNRISHFKGRPYPVEELRLTSFENILKFASNVTLRHPKKKARLCEDVKYINEQKAIVPLWEQVAFWLKVEAHTWQEIANKYGLTKKQVDSLLCNIKKHYEIERMPPPRLLTKYIVKDPS